jgi:uncharacterized membrane protein (Fun14 family)
MDIKRYIKLALILIGVSLITVFNAQETPVPTIKQTNEGVEISVTRSQESIMTANGITHCNKITE